VPEDGSGYPINEDGTFQYSVYVEGERTSAPAYESGFVGLAVWGTYQNNPTGYELYYIKIEPLAGFEPHPPLFPQPEEETQPDATAPEENNIAPDAEDEPVDDDLDVNEPEEDDEPENNDVPATDEPATGDVTASTEIPSSNETGSTNANNTGADDKTEFPILIYVIIATILFSASIFIVLKKKT